jgi:hypothetical protein
VKSLRTETFWLRIDDEKGEISIEADGDTRIVLTAIDLSLESSTVLAKGANGRKVEVSATAVSINDGALEVT